MATVRSLGFSIFTRYDGSGIRDAARDIREFDGSIRSSTNSLNSWSGRIILATKAAAVFAPALVPIAANLAAIGAAGAAMGASVGTGLAAYGAAMKGAITETLAAKDNISKLRSELDKQKAVLAGLTPGTEAYRKQLKEIAATQKELDASLRALSPTQRSFITATDQMSAAWKKLIDQTKDKTLATATNVVRGLTAGIGLLKPIIDALHPTILKVSKDFETWMKGDSAKKYADLIKTSAVPALQNLVAAGKDVINVLGDAFRAFLPNGVALTESLKNGAAALKAWSDGGGFQRFLAYVRENGPQVREFFRVLGDALRVIGQALKELGPFSLGLVTAILQLVAALPPSWIELIVKGFVAWKVAMAAFTVAKLIAGLVTLVPLVWAFTAALLANPITWVVLAIVALGAALFMLVKHWDTVKAALGTAWNATWNAMKTAAETVWNALQTAWQAVCSAFSTAWQTVSGALSTAWNTVWNAIKTAAETVWNAIKTAWNAVCTAFATAWTAVSTALTTAWNTVWNGLKTAAEAVWNAIKTAWNAVCTAFSTAWTAVGGALSTAWNTVWNAIKTAAETVWNALKTAWNAFIQGLQTIWTTVSTALSTAWNTVWNALKTAAETVWNALKTAWQAVLTAIQTAWTTVSTALKTAWDTVWNALKTAAETVWNALKTAWQAFLTAVQTIWTTVSTALKTAWDTVWNAIKTAAETVWNALKTAWEAFLNAIKTAWDTVSEALKSVWQTVWNWIKETAATIWESVKSAWEALLNAVKTAWDTFSNTLKTAWEETWNTVRDIARKIWNAIADIIGKAVNGVIKIINGLIKGFNNITGFLSLDVKIGEIGEVSVPTFAKGGTVNLRNGGTLSGYAPGRDTVPAVLSKGEGVLTPEAVRGLGGPGFVNSANRKFAGHRGAGRGAGNFDAFGNQLFAVGGMTAAALSRAGVSLGMVTQGEHSNGSLSAGTHLGGGAVDIASTSPAVLQRLIAAGFAAWIRGPAEGMSPHIHAVLMNHPELSPQAAAQVASFRAGGSGLGVGGGGGGGIDVMGMLAPHIGKILLNVYRGLSPLAGIAGAIANLFGGGGGAAGEVDNGLSSSSQADRRRELMDRIERNPNDRQAIEELSKLTDTGMNREAIAVQPAPYTGRPSVAVGGARNTAGISSGAGAGALGIAGMLAQFVLPAIKKEHIATALTDPIKEFGSFDIGGGMGKIAAGFGKKITDDVIPDFILKKAAAATPPTLPGAGGGGGNVQQWSTLAAQALQRAGLSPSQLGAFLALMQAESGGNPASINVTDSNAMKGQPSQGLMQVIPSTFAAYRDPSLPNNILDPLANMTAAARYIKARYGGQVPGSPYADGTTSATTGLHLVGEEGPELITSPGYANFAGGETVYDATDTAAILDNMAPPLVTPEVPASGMPEAAAMQSPLLEQMTAFSGAPQVEGWFGPIIAAAQHMLTTVQTAWTGTVGAGSAAQPVITATTTAVGHEVGVQIPMNLEAMATSATANWTAMTATSQAQWAAQLATVYTPAETHMGTTMPAMSLAMQTAHDLAWTTMNATSLAQWTIMRDTTYAEAELHMGTTMPQMSVTMQTAHDLAWTTMQATSLAQWTLIRDGQLIPFEEHMQTTMPAAAQTMSEQVSAAFTEMVATIIEQLDAAIAKIEEFIAATEAAIAAAQALAAAQAAAAAGGGGGPGSGSVAMGGSLMEALQRAGVDTGSIIQGEYSDGALSAGTHSGAGVVDLPYSEATLQALLANGFAAWARVGGSWAGNEHIHAVQIGNPGLSPQAAWQVQDFLAGGSGLGIPGNLAVGTNSAARGWTWVGEEGPELMRMRGGEQVMPHRASLAYAASVKSWAGGAFSTGSGAARGFRMSFGDIGGSIRGARGEGQAVNVEFNFNGPVSNGDDVRRAVDESIPKLRSAIQAGSGRRIGG
ncbi:transglycosylase SLT domain-containing protein [Streptomyces hydrogenans]|uniref:Transglycosylase SLT domain-containing protein n=1 Tax=Streptomyces hydrogenans TaxID=1873719 RepID=A0ABQ3PJR3_9ACTN|nr:transglycosylase SLT domain-containing protein [Streptomyces hydrogenans]GHG09683.1 hypothetical protein GCM10018784_22830 [Streptomyces hydrogenans]GHI25265.1 hypothetical protein Shyd_66360 [Streptomyces hydrogenans]